MQIKINPKKLLHSNQLYIHDNLKRFNVIVCGRRFGKTRLAAFEIITSALESPGVYWWVSPTFSIGTPAWRLVKKTLLILFGNSVKILESTRIIELPNQSIIEFKSADNPDSLRGEGLSGLVIDECAQIKEEAWTLSLRPALSDKEGWVIFIGTPKGRNWFFHLYFFADRIENWAKFTYSSYDNPYIKKEEIDSARLTTPDIEFRQEYLAEFIHEEGAIFRREWFDKRELVTDFIARFISWDTAASVSDSAAYSSCTVGELTPDYKLFIREVYRGRLEFPQLQDKIEEIAKKYKFNLKQIVVESKSSGISVIQSLKQSSEPWISNILVPFNPTVDKPSRAYNASLWCENNSVILPPPSKEFPWLYEFEEELFSFPQSEYLDQVDSFNQLIIFLSNYLSIGYRTRYGLLGEQILNDSIL